MRKLLLTPSLSDGEVRSLRGQLLNWSHYDEPIIGGEDGEDTTVFMPKGGVLLVYLRKPHGVLEEMKKALPALRVAAKWSTNRQEYSGTMGYLDPDGREPYHRSSAFTRDEPGPWKSVQPLLRRLDSVFSLALPDRYINQKLFADRTRADLVIPRTVFTTVTVNKATLDRPCRFRCHQDRNNLSHGMGVMTVWRRGHFGGGSLIFPQWRKAVDMQSGDVLLFGGDEWHGNAPFAADSQYERISVVCYYRRGMFKAKLPR